MNPEAYEDMAQAQSTHWWFVARKQILRSELERLSLPTSARILEIGSGTGANLELLREFGDVTGLEMNLAALAHARRTVSNDIELLEGQWPCNSESFSCRFDLVCLFDVLEHIDDEGGALASLEAVLKPGGLILLTVPAYSWLWGPHDLMLHHKRRYTHHRLAMSLESVGLQMQRSSHFNTLLFPFACASRVLAKLSHVYTRPGQLPHRTVNRLLTSIFASERHLLRLGRLPFGLSLLAVVQVRP